MKEDIILKIKEKESLEVIKIIAIIYLVFLFFLALILGYQETIIQVLLIVTFVIIIDAINSSEIVITEKGITLKSLGFIKYGKIYRLKKEKNILYIYDRELKKPHKVIFSMSEDKKMIENAYRYIDSKIKTIEEENKEHQEYVENFL